MSKDPVAAARAHFTEADLLVIGEGAVTLGTGEARDAVELAVAWRVQVAKINADRDRAWEDRTVWTEHDLAGALSMRSYLELALGRISMSLRQGVYDELVRSTDDLYRSFTVEDPTSIMTSIGEVPGDIDGWWWHREPTSGPIVRDVRQWRAILAKQDGRPG